jgi:hypothetical protein
MRIIKKKGIYIVVDFRGKGFMPVVLPEKVASVGDGVKRARQATQGCAPEFLARYRVEENGRIKFECRREPDGRIAESIMV